MHIFDMPDVMIREVFECLSYDEVAKLRLVCRRFDENAKIVLNHGFHKVMKQHNIVLRRIKALLPRRESERRNHCLARHSDILTSVETRISMLSMTYSKFIDKNLCCFIPGRVLDELFRILRLISKTNKLLRPHDVLQELRDVSSMAIEHFDEKVAIGLRKKYYNYGTSSNDGPLRGMGTFLSATLCMYGADNFFPDSATRRLGLIGEHSNDNYLNTNLNDSKLLQSSLPSTSKGVLKCQHPIRVCPEARQTINFKKLEKDYKKGIKKIHHMQQVQNIQNKMLQKTLTTIGKLKMQMVAYKKRLEHVDAKNRELSQNMINMTGVCCTNKNNTATATSESNNNVEDQVSSLSPGTSSSAERKKKANSNKRSTDEANIILDQVEDHEKPKDNCEHQLKKLKLPS